MKLLTLLLSQLAAEGEEIEVEVEEEVAVD